MNICMIGPNSEAGMLLKHKSTNQVIIKILIYFFPHSLYLFGVLKDKEQDKPLIVNTVSMPLWMWSVTWQWSNQVPGFPATISTVWKVPGKRSKTSARCTLSVCRAITVKKGKQRMGNKHRVKNQTTTPRIIQHSHNHSITPPGWDCWATVLIQNHQGFSYDLPCR